MDEKAQKILYGLQNLCSKREYCIKDIRRKAIEKLDGDNSAADSIIESLLSDKYLDESRYASCFAREKAGISGWGPIKITHQLRAKGISSAIIAEALAEIDNDKADDKLEKLLRNKYRSLEGDPHAKLKLLKFALGRGYEYNELLKNLVDQISRSL